MIDSHVPSERTERRVRIAAGTHVEIMMIDEGGGCEALEFDLVPDSKADFAHGLLGINTPLARAIVGHAQAEVVPYRAEDVSAVRIVKVRPSTTTPLTDKEIERQAVIDKAVAQSDALNDAAFALAAGSKWGDYDPAAEAREVIPTAAKQNTAKKAKRRSA